MALTDDHVFINDMDTQGDVDQYTATTFGALGLNDSTSQVPVFREVGCGEGQIDVATGDWTDDFAALDITGGIRGDKLIGIWLWTPSPGALANMGEFTVGIFDAVGGAADGGRWDFRPVFQNKDTYGWHPCLVYPTQPDTAVGTFGNMSKTALRSLEVRSVNGSGLQIRLIGLEQSYHISYIGGHSQTVTLDNLVTHSKDKTSDQDMGVMFSQGDAYKTVVVIRLGHATATAATTFNETAKVIHFDNFNTDHDIGFNFINDVSGDTLAFTLTGCFLFWNDGASDVFVGVANVDTWSITGNTFLRGGAIELPPHATGFVTNTNVFDTCGEVDIGDATFEDNTIKGATSGVLYTGTGTRRAKNNSYLNCTDALHFDTAQTITLDGDQFSGNTDDIHFSGTGTLTINPTNGANPVTSRVSGGGTVVINQPPATTQILVQDSRDFSNLARAAVLILASDATGDLPFDDTVTITRVANIASVSHTAHGLVNGNKVQITGAVQTDYNGIKIVSNVTANAYDFIIATTPTTPATGTIKATGVVISGLSGPTTNELKQSETFDNAAWSKTNVTVTPNTTVAPDGNTTADTANATSASHNLTDRLNDGAGDAILGDTDYIFSFYALQGTHASPQFSIFDFTNTANIIPPTDYAALVNTTQWVRIAINFRTGPGVTDIGVYPMRDGGTGTMFFWGAMLEKGVGDPSDYLVTAGATATSPAGIKDIRAWTLAQNIAGKVRIGTVEPFFKDGIITGQILTAGGFSQTVLPAFDG